MTNWYAIGKIPLVGLTAIITTGVVSCALLTLAAIWLLVQVGMILLTGIIETLTSIGATYNGASPTIRLIVLVAAIAYILYRVHSKQRKVQSERSTD